jgi:colicin import membrane protein
MRSLVTLSILGASIVNSATGLVPQVSISNLEPSNINSGENSVTKISDNYNFEYNQNLGNIKDDFTEYKAVEVAKYEKDLAEQKRIAQEQEERRKQEEIDRQKRVAEQQKEAQEAAQKQIRLAAAAQPAPSSSLAVNIPSGGIKSDAYNLIKSLGYSDTDWAAIDYIISRESTWNPNATNPTSGACGLPQANPCSSSKFGKYADFKTNWQSQLNWFLDYVKSRYGSPTKAYEFWLVNRWY